ncbi:hypothetical protein CWC04_17975 [Pseudoalteromonas sp. S2893]|nr:hypothetical protein CWC04_17975 [Pseudoalteromonas sp. S2893]
MFFFWFYTLLNLQKAIHLTLQGRFMEFCVLKDKEKIEFESFSLFKGWAEKSLGLNFIGNDISFFSVSLATRLFIFKFDDVLYVSDSLAGVTDYLKNSEELPDSVGFYKKFGFILPPFTQYSGVYITAPYIRFDISEIGIKYSSYYPSIDSLATNSTPSLEQELSAFFSKLDPSIKLDILVSGGIDSSALLGFVNDKFTLSKSIMCQMTSLPKEGIIANELCDSIRIPFESHNLDTDLSNRASEFIDETGEYISDSISLVFPELFDRISEPHQAKYLIDGQGADSLLNGLPLDKVYTLWTRLSWAKYLFYPLSKLPIYKDKSSPLKRKLYRFSKAIKCLTQLDFRNSILCAMTEDESITTDHEKYFLSELEDLHNKYQDWHLVLRVVYLFRVLPAREMQKYLLAKKYNINIVAPFLDDDLINAYLFTPNSETIKKGIYKYPITILAQRYWPGYFETSKTSPFQINYRLGLNDIKSFSIEKIRKAINGTSNS